MVAEPTTEHTAWDCDQPKCGIPVSADQRKILTSGAGLSALQQLRVQSHLIAQVEALTEQLDEARVVMRHYVDHVRSHGHADSDAEAMEILLGAWAEEKS